MQRLEAIFHGYALLMGLTSYRLVRGRFRQTRTTKTYVWGVNLSLLAALPYCLWTMAKYNSSIPLFPRFIKVAPYVSNSVLYGVVLYTVASRCYRDDITLELQKLVTQVDREMTRSGKKTSSKLMYVLCIKAFISANLVLSSIVSSFIYGSPLALHLRPKISSLVNNIGQNVVMGNVLLYFLSIWHIARGYDFINASIEELISGRKPHSSSKKKELYRLWALHFDLGRTAKRINTLFGPQMLAARFNFLVFSVINGYLGMLFFTDNFTLWYFTYSWAILISFRSLGSFLSDYLIGLATEYQSKRGDWVTEKEGSMSKEVAAYIIYESSMKAEMTFCGLFKPNRGSWLKMMELIFNHFILLLQFQLVLGRK